MPKETINNVITDRALQALLNRAEVLPLERLGACKILEELDFAESEVIENKEAGNIHRHYIFMSTEDLEKFLSPKDDDDNNVSGN